MIPVGLARVMRKLFLLLVIGVMASHAWSYLTRSGAALAFDQDDPSVTHLSPAQDSQETRFAATSEPYFDSDGDTDVDDDGISDSGDDPDDARQVTLYLGNAPVRVVTRLIVSLWAFLPSFRGDGLIEPPEVEGKTLFA